MRTIAHFSIRICAEASQILGIEIPVWDFYSGADAELEVRRACLSVKRFGMEVKMKILVINGPNLNFLESGKRPYMGRRIMNICSPCFRRRERKRAVRWRRFRATTKGAIIDRIQEAYFDGTDGIVINPGAYTHYSYAIRDALASVQMPKVEIHISDITAREEFRKVSVTAPACDRQIYGHGLEGYLEAIDSILAE